MSLIGIRASRPRSTYLYTQVPSGFTDVTNGGANWAWAVSTNYSAVTSNISNKGGFKTSDTTTTIGAIGGIQLKSTAVLANILNGYYPIEIFVNFTFKSISFNNKHVASCGLGPITIPVANSIPTNNYFSSLQGTIPLNQNNSFINISAQDLIFPAPNNIVQSIGVEFIGLKFIKL